MSRLSGALAGLVLCGISTVGCGESMTDPVASEMTRGTLTLPVGSCSVNFEATVRSGPSAGTSLVGFATFMADNTGNLHHASMHTAEGRVLPITGRVEGNNITLRFDLGDGRFIDGSGALQGTLQRCSGEMTGALTGPLPGDTGDWLGGDGEIEFIDNDGEVMTDLVRGTEINLPIVRQDAGLVVNPDVGFIPAQDAGNPIQDSGFPIQDAGNPVQDVVLLPQDSGSPPPPPPPPVGSTDGQTVQSPAGQIFISVPLQHIVYRAVSDSSPLAVFVGALNQPGNVDGTRALSRLRNPTGLAFDGPRNVLYIADTGNNQVRKVFIGVNSVVTIARASNVSGASISAGFPALSAFGARGVAVESGNIYVSDRTNAVVWQFNGNTFGPALFAGRPRMPGNSDGIGTLAQFNQPSQMIASPGLLAVTDGCRVRLVDVGNRQVSTVSGGCF